MKARTGEERILRSYLLGDLGEEAQERLENRLMTEPQVFDDLRLMEDELVDEYVSDELKGEERRQFESHFLASPERRGQRHFAAALRRYIESHPLPAWPVEEPRGGKVLPFVRRLAEFGSRAAWQPAMAAALVALVVGGGWLLVENRQLADRLQELVASTATLETQSRLWQEELAAERVRGEGLSDELAAQRTQTAALHQEIEDLRSRAGLPPANSALTALTAVATAWLTPGMLRGGGEMERLILPADSALVRLQLDLGIDDYPSYRAVLQDAEGDEIWSQSKLRAQTVEERVAVSLVLPAELLPRGDYSIRLSGDTASGERELAGRYYFRVIPE